MTDQRKTSASEKDGSHRFLEEVRFAPIGSVHISRLLRRGLFMALGVIALFFMQDQLRQVLEAVPRLRTVSVRWFAAMFVLQTISFSCTWTLTKIVLPTVSWFVAITAQLASNAVSRVVPGGAAIGGATLYRILAVSGVDKAQAVGALAATSIPTTGVIFAVPTAALLLALLGASIPPALLPSAVAGAVLFVVFVVFGTIAVRYDRPLWLLGQAVNWVWSRIGRIFGHTWQVSSQHWLDERDRLVGVVEGRWVQVLLASGGKWVFDYFTLIAALYGVGVDPRFSLVLLAYAGAAVAAMIPITPGGFGFVEFGLLSILGLSGVGLNDAALATMAYRVASLWLPIVAGVFAWALFRWAEPGLASGNATDPQTA